MRKIIAATVLIASTPAMAWAACGPEVEIRSVADEGATVALSDNSVWTVERADRVFVRTWLHAEKAAICDGRLTNINQRQSVTAEKVH